MSDDDRDNDIESDDEVDYPDNFYFKSSKQKKAADKRAHHNALERKRRDHIKDSFSSLRDSLPYFQGDKVRDKKQTGKKRSSGNAMLIENSDDSCDVPVKRTKKPDKASRAQILKKAADYIQAMRRKNSAHQQDIDDLKRQNKALEDQIRSLEKAKSTGNYAAAAAVIEHCSLTNNKPSAVAGFDGDSDSDESSENSDESKDSPRKRLKTNSDVPMRT